MDRLLHSLAKSNLPARFFCMPLAIADNPDRPGLPPTLPTVVVGGLYVHVPFCRHKCHYCDFYSVTGQSTDRMERFVDLILREASYWSDGRRGSVVRPTTVFFGGGTPTLLPIEAMRRLIRGVRQLLDLSGMTEWTVEANPATVSEPYARMLREEGVDRLSFGAQSFASGELATLERLHDPADVARSVAIARAAGFARLNIDLIYAIPGQDLASWSATLEQALALNTEHISCYALTYEAETPITRRRNLGQIRPVDETLELEMMRLARVRLASAGLPAYEISNHARKGDECRHNLCYWNGENYIGLGPSAASHVQGWRWKNQPHLDHWEQAVADDRLPASDVEHLTPMRRAGELAMLQLRLTSGVDFADFARRSGVDARVVFGPLVEELSKVGLLERSPAGFAISERGIAVADAIAARFLQSPVIGRP